ncbi:chromosome partitioning protein ParA [Erythrobacter sp. SG61-1L]|uniref:Mrp/NBP35 family ATP-binding protein n=1 Tax=Erythrobacter sp. SG61-1L TaxID=1603897 RepID=UPI0006C934BC|nr:Mrp/NBP35 family ATP-binding protein [Erythrobacter sp. SG61-1L]KPL69415.1 chromosome partitioning protein ParA [Erythrobacter sp. SG61-1L]
MSSEDILKSRLPAMALERLQTLRLSDGVATLILDASGLDALARDRLEIAVRDTLRDAEGVSEVRVALMADKAPPAARRIVAIGSGKGGVGKSTLTANLAVALKKAGRKVGVVDADIYGPSQPTLLASEGERPRAEGNKLIPVPSAAGIPVLSMGHLVEPGKAIAWRGPMAGNALGQLIDAEWGDVDVLLIDLPPGTGDVQLTMLQRFKPAGAVIVSTPQDLALIDATRAMQLFEAGQVPIIGIVENMAGYICPHCGEVSDPFGHGGAEIAAREKGVDFLGRVPLAMEIRMASDAGTPPAAGDGAEAQAFAAIAARISDWLGA